jgi:hypothetical protein
MQVFFDKLAEAEYYDTVSYYEFELPGLGLKFKEEIIRAIQNIVSFPLSGNLEDKEIRHYLLYKFPFKILYSIEAKYIYIIAIAHMHREPNYWIDRG